MDVKRVGVREDRAESEPVGRSSASALFLF